MQIRALGKKRPGATPTPELTPTAAMPPEVDIVADIHDDERIDPSSLPFCAGIDPDNPESAMTGKINKEVDEKFVDASYARCRARRLNDLKGIDSLYEYACSDDSLIGQKAEQLGIKCTCLT